MDLSVILIILQLIYLEGILSIDNAAVLAALVSPLPSDEPVPWPRILRWLSKPVHRIFGPQRMAALKVGLLGAYLGRGLMLVLASYIIRNPWLIFLGALYLIKLGADHLGDEATYSTNPDGENIHVATIQTAEKGFWSVVLSVELADLAFSLDNVVAAVALSNRLWVVMTGVAIGILTMRFAAGIFVLLIEREPILKPAAFILVFIIGMEVLIQRLTGIHLGDLTRFSISAGTILLTIVYAHLPPLQWVGRRLRWIRSVFRGVNLVLSFAVRPVVWVFSSFVSGLKVIGGRITTAMRQERL
ncbi:MAG: tellurium resistance protein TerC [Armatimonadota bacterium]|nr:tellurium resistance protein TerC [Armatimonadota bacterium]MDR5703675.1 tellurium resistance protein TerC [Armatimonadota bacterium]MDR7435304.1 tellurium resistance protein TerC [Armatimonadota bacterium]